MKTRRIAALLLLIAMAVFAFASCGRVGEEGDVTVVIENRDGSYTVYKTYLENVENKDEGAAGVLESLAAREESPLTVTMSESTYGKTVDAIGSLTPDFGKNEFICIYTSLAADFDTSAYAKTLEYDGVTMSTSGLGISSMTVQAGTVILFRIETW